MKTHEAADHNHSEVEMLPRYHWITTPALLQISQKYPLVKPLSHEVSTSCENIFNSTKLQNVRFTVTRFTQTVTNILKQWQLWRQTDLFFSLREESSFRTRKFVPEMLHVKRAAKNKFQMTALSTLFYCFNFQRCNRIKTRMRYSTGWFYFIKHQWEFAIHWQRFMRSTWHRLLTTLASLKDHVIPGFRSNKLLCLKVFLTKTNPHRKKQLLIFKLTTRHLKSTFG